MKFIWQKLGMVIFWLGWPAFWLILRGSSRTRLLIVCKGKVLVVKNWLGSGKWSLPGGGMHAGETPRAGVLREVAEEIGIPVTTITPKLLATLPYRDKGFEYLCHYFAAEVSKQPAFKLQRPEIFDAAWVKQKELNMSNANKDVLEALSLRRKAR